MDRLSTLDNSFLRIESPSAHMHVGWLAELKLPESQPELNSLLLIESIERRLHLAPRFRKRLEAMPLGEPCWIDDRAFSLERHIEIVEGVERLSRRRVGELADAFLSEQLDRTHPLWKLLLLPRVEGGRAAIVGKVHHALVDGIAAVDLGMLLFDSSRLTVLHGAEEWRPEPLGNRVRTSVDAVADSALDQFRVARRMAALGLAPRRSIRVAETMRRAALSLAEDALRPAPPSFLNRPIGPRRALITQRVAMERLQRVKSACDAKLNDVVLAVVAGALRRFAALIEERPIPVRVMVPVNVRRPGEEDASGNRITFAFIQLPVDEPDPLRRVARVKSRMSELKTSQRISGSEALLRSASQLPGPIKQAVARFASSPRMYNLTVSNVPGPGAPIYAAGAEVESIYPVIPVADEHALSIGALSYAGNLHFSAYVEPDALPEAPELAQLLDAAVDELESAVGMSRPHAGAERLRSHHKDLDRAARRTRQ